MRIFIFKLSYSRQLRGLKLNRNKVNFLSNALQFFFHKTYSPITATGCYVTKEIV